MQIVSMASAWFVYDGEALVIKNDLPVAETFLLPINGTPTNIEIPAKDERYFYLIERTRVLLDEIKSRFGNKTIELTPELVSFILHNFNLSLTKPAVRR